MNKKLTASFLMLAVFALTVSVFAQGSGHRNHSGDMSDELVKVDIENVKKFQKETSQTRDDMMIKKIELAQEKAKEKPDLNKVASLQKDMIDLKTKIQTAARKYGLPEEHFGMMGCGMDGGGPKGHHGCSKCRHK